ncbi:MAG: hypothetical protein JW925_05755 [Syntrophaceae bacterium]|nr:hypothetical protein [Syntrophaceae bacterium]
MTKNYHTVWILILFVVSFFVVRIPLLQEPLGFEEGIFAELIVHRPSGPFYALTGRIDGENIYGHISHPAFSYELLRLGGNLSRPFLTHDVYLNDSLVTPRLRIISSFYQFTFFGALLLFSLLRHSHDKKWPVLLIFAAMLSPLAIKTSVHLQIDNTAGVLFCGTAALLFITAGQIKVIGTRFLLVLAGGFIAGLGKQEWSFALLAALITISVAMFFVKTTRDGHAIYMLLCATLGLAAGNLSSYLYDPVNYLRALHFIVYFSKLHETSSGSWELGHWLILMKHRARFIFICMVLSLPFLFSWFSRQHCGVFFYLTFFFGFYLLLGYIVSDWNYEPRYFCPSLAVLSVSAIATTPGSVPRWPRMICLTATLLVFLSAIIFCIGFEPDRNLHLEKINKGTLQSSQDTVLCINSGSGWNKPNINYVNNNMPFSILEKSIWERYHKMLINPDDIDMAK